MLFRWVVVILCFLYWEAWKCKAGHWGVPSSTNSYKKNIDKIIMADKKAKSFLRTRAVNGGQVQSLRAECCKENACSFEEQSEINMSWDGVFQGLCEISIKEGRNCYCGRQSGGYIECASDFVGKKNCEHPCPHGDYFYCSYDRKCVLYEKQCNSYNDCGNWNDEKSCGLWSRNSETSIKSNTELRVSENISKYYGDVFIFNRPVCHTGFNQESARVICKTMGFLEDTKALFHNNSHFGSPTKNNYIIGNVNCNGKESYIGECGHETINSCHESNGAGVTCIVMKTLKLESSSYTNGGDVYLIGLPFVSTHYKAEIPRWGYREAQAVCNYLIGDEFDRGTNGVPVYSYYDSKQFSSPFCLELWCPDKEMNSIMQCHISLHKDCNGFTKAVQCARCTPKKLIEILEGMTLEGNYIELIKSASDALIKLDQSCYLWTDCYLPNPCYPEYCLVRGLLDDILTQSSLNKGKNNVVIETSIDPTKLLENTFLNQKFLQIQNQINNLDDALTSNLGKYFGELADFDEQVGAADVSYTQNSWMRALHMLENKRREFAGQLEDIFIFAFSVESADMRQSVAALALAAASMGNPIDLLVNGASSILEFQNRVNDVAKSANVIAKLSFLHVDFLPRLKELSRRMSNELKKNEDVYTTLHKFLIDSPDKNFTSEHAKRFLKAYNDFSPALSDNIVQEHGALLEQMITQCCDVIQNPDTALGAVPALISAAIGSCPNAKVNINILNGLVGTMNAKQTEIMDSYAKVARAKLAASNARNLKNSLKKSYMQRFESKILALKAHFLLQYHKLTLIEMACNYLTYMNFGLEPHVCGWLLQNPNRDIGSLISMEKCKMCNCPGVISKSGVFRIPAKFGVFEKGTIDLSSLYSINKQNKQTNGSTFFVIPGREWLVENKWIHTDQVGPFFLQSLNIFLPPTSSYEHTLSLKMDSFASELNEKSFAIDKGTVIENSYTENPSKSCRNIEPNPYDAIACMSKLGNICIDTEGKINGKLLPRLENSSWKISLRSDYALEVPYPAEKFYLYARATFCYKGVANKKKAARRSNISPGHVKCCLNERKYYDPVAKRCNSCPTDSEPRLYDHYCESCPAGYQTSKGRFGCQPCKPGYYKRKAGPGNCKKCPAGKVALLEGSQFCI